MLLVLVECLFISSASCGELLALQLTFSLFLSLHNFSVLFMDKIFGYLQLKMSLLTVRLVLTLVDPRKFVAVFKFAQMCGVISG